MYGVCVCVSVLFHFFSSVYTLCLFVYLYHFYVSQCFIPLLSCLFAMECGFFLSLQFSERLKPRTWSNATKWKEMMTRERKTRDESMISIIGAFALLHGIIGSVAQE